MRYAIWYHLHNLKNVRNTHGGVLLLVKLQALACNFTKRNTPPWMFLRFLNCTNDTKSRNGSQIPNRTTHHICISLTHWATLPNLPNLLYSYISTLLPHIFFSSFLDIILSTINCSYHAMHIFLLQILLLNQNLQV